MSLFTLFSKNKKNTSSTSPQSTNKLLSKMADQDLILQEKLEKLEKQKNLRNFKFLEDEKDIKEREENKILEHQKKNNKEKLIQMMLTDEEKTNRLVSSVQKENLLKHEKFLNYLKEVEKSSKELINNTLNFNQTFQMDYCEKYSKCDSIVRLKDSDGLKLRKDDTEFVLKLEQIIEEKNIQHCVLLNKVCNDDFYDMEVLTNLLNTNNCYHQVLKEHLKCMYNQLKYLTAAELQKQNSLLNKQINNLSYERITITQMLVDLVEKKKENQKYLIKKLEAQNIELGIATKWLSQCSKLVNNMPSDLKFSKNTIDATLLHRVCRAGGSHLLLFILENELQFPLSKEYLTNMGVHNHRDQDILMNTLNNCLTQSKQSTSLENEFSASAPCLDEFDCIVCMELQFDVLFIPCGHLCCCQKCSEKVTLCPMCRANISKKVYIKM